MNDDLQILISLLSVTLASRAIYNTWKIRRVLKQLHKEAAWLAFEVGKAKGEAERERYQSTQNDALHNENNADLL